MHIFTLPKLFFFKVAFVPVIIAVGTLQWFYFQPSYAHNSSATPAECHRIKQQMDEAYTAFGKAVIALEDAKANAVTEVKYDCLIAGFLAFSVTFVFTGPLAGIGVGVATCAGILLKNVLTKTPGLAQLVANMNAARDRYNTLANTYTNCMEVHLFTYH